LRAKKPFVKPSCGDEDVRVGVQIAQIYGVRVHLLGIKPSRGSQSQQLLQEADTTTEWDATVVSRFLSVRPPKIAAEKASEKVASVAAQSEILLTQNGPALDAEALDTMVEAFVGTLVSSDLDAISVYWQTERGVPSEYDKKLLPCGRTALGRNLERHEMRYVRAKFQTLVRAKFENKAAPDVVPVPLKQKPRARGK
jgi:hypothetical protein